MCLEATVLGRPELKVEQKGQDRLCLPEPTGESVFLLPSALLHADESCSGRYKDWALASAQPGNRAAGLGRSLGPLEAAACAEMGGQVQCTRAGSRAHPPSSSQSRALSHPPFSSIGFCYSSLSFSAQPSISFLPDALLCSAWRTAMK